MVPHDALFISVSDFTYSGYDTSIISFNSTTGIITPKAVGTTRITIIHKPTNYKYYLKINVLDNPTYLGTLSVWNNGESNRIAYKESAVKLFYGNIGTTTNNHLQEACNTAISQWSSALGISINAENNAEKADVKVCSGDIETIREYGVDIEGSQGGLTDYEPSELEFVGYYLYGKSAKSLFKMPPSVIYIAYEAGLTLKDYQATCTHELGHALGYLGHSKMETDVMYYLDPETYMLSANEKAHLKQVY